MKINERPINVLIIDDHPLFRLGIFKILRNIPYINDIFEADNGLKGLKIIENEKIDLVFLDIQMPILDGLETFLIIKEKFNFLKVIVLTFSDSKRQIVNFIKNGVNAFLLKSTDSNEIETALELVMDNGVYFNPKVYNIWSEYLINKTKFERTTKSTAQLTNREKEIVILICEQLSTRQIAQKLYVEEITISNHRYHIMKKLNTNNVVGIVLYAVRTGLFSP